MGSYTIGYGRPNNDMAYADALARADKRRAEDRANSAMVAQSAQIDRNRNDQLAARAQDRADRLAQQQSSQNFQAASEDRRFQYQTARDRMQNQYNTERDQRNIAARQQNTADNFQTSQQNAYAARRDARLGRRYY